MKCRGRIIFKAPVEKGVSNSGNPWVTQGYVLETFQNFPKKIYFTFRNDRIDQYPLNVGDIVSVDFDIDSHEFQGRWYTEVNAWKAEVDRLPEQPTMTKQVYQQATLDATANPSWQAIQANAQGAPVSQTPWTQNPNPNPFGQV